jgi:NADP-dependent 3-hydroxy acid dehydrogenase YdfG
MSKSKTIIENAKKDTLPLQVLELDVTFDNKSVEDAINNILNEKKRIDVVVNNAGYGLTGAFENPSMYEITAQFETNSFRAIRVIQAVLPTMRNHRKGTIVNMSSMGDNNPYPHHDNLVVLFSHFLFQRAFLGSRETH